jgi:hypothetical protein
VNDIEMLIVLLAVAAGAIWLAAAISIPYPILLLLAGVGIGFLPGLPSVELGRTSSSSSSCRRSCTLPPGRARRSTSARSPGRSGSSPSAT